MLVRIICNPFFHSLTFLPQSRDLVAIPLALILLQFPGPRPQPSQTRLLHQKAAIRMQIIKYETLTT